MPWHPTHRSEHLTIGDITLQQLSLNHRRTLSRALPSAATNPAA